MCQLLKPIHTGNRTGMRCMFLCDSHAVLCGAISAHTFWMSWNRTTLKVVDALLFKTHWSRIAWYFCAMQFGASKCTGFATCVFGSLYLKSWNPMQIATAVWFGKECRKRTRIVGFLHCISGVNQSLLHLGALPHFLVIYQFKVRLSMEYWCTHVKVLNGTRCGRVESQRKKLKSVYNIPWNQWEKKRQYIVNAIKKKLVYYFLLAWNVHFKKEYSILVVGL